MIHIADRKEANPSLKARHRRLSLKTKLTANTYLYLLKHYRDVWLRLLGVGVVLSVLSVPQPTAEALAH